MRILILNVQTRRCGCCSTLSRLGRRKPRCSTRAIRKTTSRLRCLTPSTNGWGRELYNSGVLRRRAACSRAVLSVRPATLLAEKKSRRSKPELRLKRRSSRRTQSRITPWRFSRLAQGAQAASPPFRPPGWHPGAWLQDDRYRVYRIKFWPTSRSFQKRSPTVRTSRPSGSGALTAIRAACWASMGAGRCNAIRSGRD